VGQKGSLSYVWAPVGSRPAMVRDNRHDAVYIFGAICPERGVGPATVLFGFVRFCSVCTGVLFGWQRNWSVRHRPANLPLLRGGLNPLVSPTSARPWPVSTSRPLDARAG